MVRGALLTMLPALGLVACAPDSDDNRSAPSPIPGYELASAGRSAPIAALSVTELSVAQLDEALASRNIRLIDIRTDEEVAEGMIPGAEHIAMDRFDPAKVIATDAREIILYCRSDRRSQIVAEKLAAYTGKPVQHLDGGIIAWREAGKAIALPR
jgi:rhodanese-related sulfurtransferase